MDEVKRLKEGNKHCQNQEKERTLDEESTKRPQGEICKKVEESLNIDKVKLEMQSIVEEGCHNLINGVTLKLEKEK